ncbi:beta ketoadipyl CoA thiolase, th1 [Datura stramonium]|uniref:Beta ketoadipyl CoA thiolase, th1 n=1 Tax=Datura stramonium TaxID=4076 RepID=A0ABS8T6X3_DATST|nr:beta ketoadipyl CoA thiolase, th1 [Datura stramonium]
MPAGIETETRIAVGRDKIAVAKDAVESRRSLHQKAQPYRFLHLKAMQDNKVSMPTPGDESKVRVPHVLTVAGSDSGAGAGIQADLKACAARGVYCLPVITAVTAQNTLGVQGVNIVPEDFVAEQLRSVLSDMSPNVVKTGMLPSTGIVKTLCQTLVVDPVMVSTSGHTLAGPSILDSFRRSFSHG